MKMITTVVALNFGLLAAYAQTMPDQIREAVEKALPALQQAGPVFVKKSGCVSCHHQSLPAEATAMARARGFRYDQALETQNVQAILDVARPVRELLIEAADVVPQIPATGSHLLMGLHAQQYPADENTTAMVHAIALRQRPDGSWTGWAPRFPISGGDIRETAISIRALDIYAPPGRRPEFDRRIEKARQFLLDAKPQVPEEEVARLLGLAWSHAKADDVYAAALGVLAQQRSDGGWAQLNTRESDAYATGEALFALQASGVLGTSDEAYQRGAAYLLSTQTADGSWHVKTRAYPIQPLIDSGYPHGRDQWISAAGTSYAVMALMLSVEPIETQKKEELQ